MKSSLSRRVLFIGLIAGALVAPGMARADTAPDAKQFIDKLVNHALNVLVTTQSNEAQREEQFNQLLRDNFDFPRIARFVLGRYWRSASEQERVKFIDVYREFIVHSYAAQFREYSGEKVKVTNARAEDTDVTIVNSEIVHPNGEPAAKVNWRVHKDGDSFKILDVDVEGISMLVAQREEFSSVIQRNGGTVAGLIKAIQLKLQNNDLTIGGKS